MNYSASVTDFFKSPKWGMNLLLGAVSILIPIVIYTWHHLQKQLYRLYLARGGEAIPVSQKLADVPPALPF